MSDKESPFSRNPKVQFGAVCVRGTRITVNFIKGRFAGGDSIRQIARSYKLSEQTIRAAINYNRGRRSTVSDKETAPWITNAAKRIRIDNALTGGLSKEAIAQIIIDEHAVECTAPAPQLSFEEFQRVNKHRCETKFHQCETWLPSGWPLAIAGEAGELCNLIKKIIRGDFTFEAKRGEILKELADVIIYCDLMISAMGASTGEVVAAKFDEVSRRVNYTDRVFADVAATPQVAPDEITYTQAIQPRTGELTLDVEGTSEQAPQEREKP